MVPFTQRFPDLGDLKTGVFFMTLLSTAVATALLIAPSAHHRILWRGGLREQRLVLGNRLTIAGLIFLLPAIVGVVFVISAFIFGLTAGCGDIDPCRTPCICERLSTPSDEGYARIMLHGSTTLKTAVCAPKEQFPAPQTPKEKEGPSAQRIPAHAPSVKVAAQDTQEEDVLRRLCP